MSNQLNRLQKGAATQRDTTEAANKALAFEHAELHQQLATLKAQRDECHDLLKRVLRAFESDKEQIPDCDVLTCWETNSTIISRAQNYIAALDHQRSGKGGEVKVW